ncbi:hypothetical protein ACROYT_G014190 [Oculina patagonica]
MTLAPITEVVPLTNNGPAFGRGDDQLPPSLKESTFHITENFKKLDVRELKSSLTFLHYTTEEIKTEQKLQQERMKYFEEKLQAPNATKQQLEREVIDIPAHSMRNNLILYNIEEEKEEEAITTVPLKYKELERRGTLSFGTVRSNRECLPKDIVVHNNEQVKRLKRGDSLFHQSDNLICCTWKGKKPVHLMSTTPEGLEISQAERRLSEWKQCMSVVFAKCTNIWAYFYAGVSHDRLEPCPAWGSPLPRGVHHSALWKRSLLGLENFSLWPKADKAFIVGPGHVPIPAKLVAKITEGQFVELTDLLLVNLRAVELEPQAFLEEKLLVSN